MLRPGPTTPARTSAGLLIAAVALAGCGGASPRAKVASLPTHGAGSGTRSTSAAGGLASNEGIPDPDGRPRDTLDMTVAQINAGYVPWEHCIGQFRASKADLARCRRLAPLPPWQFDPANPQARAFVGRTVTCMQARGFHARAVLARPGAGATPYWNIVYSPSAVNDQARTHVAQHACQSQSLS